MFSRFSASNEPRQLGDGESEGIIHGWLVRYILLMVQKSGDHQLRMVVYPIIYKVLYNPGAAGCLPSTVWNHRLCRDGASHSSHGACDVYTFIMYGYALASRMLLNVESFVT